MNLTERLIEKESKPLATYETRILGWEKLKNIGVVEVWKTPTAFLTCQPYLKKFKFFSKVKEALDYAIVLNKQLQEE